VALAALASTTVPAQTQPPTARNHASTTALATALGVDCAHCHTPDRWNDAGKPAFGIAASMFRMVDAINDRLQ
jgi:mono/diheme cytochrome c family protein